MRFLHTADWHLGRILNGRDLIDDQAHALESLVDIAMHEAPDAIVIAGDVYDRSQPPERAIELLDDVLARLGAIAPLLVIPGNHDSAVRVGVNSRLLERVHVHVCGAEHGAPRVVRLSHASGEVRFHLMPYATVEAVRDALSRGDLRSHHEATVARLEAVERPSGRDVLVGHLFADGGVSCESERDISVGGVSVVRAQAFAGFAYVALGHLHRPHEVHPGVRYSGSLCRYSFSEQDHGKSVTMVAINARGGVATQEIPVDQRHGMRTLRGAFDELLKGAGSDAGRPDDFLRVRLTDTLPVFQAQAQLRTLYPNILELEYEASMAPVAGSAPDLADLSRRSEQDMLVRFLDRYPEELAAPLRKSAVSIMDEVIASKVDA
jgi:exonuclease SbcD